MKCRPDYQFVVSDSGQIELRRKDGTFIYSICCINCVDELEEKIKELRSRFK